MRQGRAGAIEIAGAQGRGQFFEKHSHDEFVISANLIGDEQVWLDGRIFTACGGDITTYNPGQIQGGGVVEAAPWHFTSLYVTPRQLANDLGLADVEFARPVRRLPGLAQAMASAVMAALSDDALVSARAEECLMALLAELVASAGMTLPRSTPIASEAVSKLQELLAERLADTPGLDEMASELQVSKFHLLRAFQKQTGLSPRQWAMQLRLRRACASLRVGTPATVVAHSLGFSDQSHFNRHFRAAYGVTPGRFQRAVRT